MKAITKRYLRDLDREFYIKIDYLSHDYFHLLEINKLEFHQAHLTLKHCYNEDNLDTCSLCAINLGYKSVILGKQYRKPNCDE